MSGSADRLQSSLSTAGYTDGLGRRSIRFDREVGGMLEALELRPEFGLYESLIRESSARLGTISQAGVCRPREILREAQGLVVLSPLPTGERLEELLDARSAEEYVVAGMDAALGFLLEALPSLDALHRVGVAHGTIAPGRIAISPRGHVTLLDCTLGAAVERLRLTRERLWASLSLVGPPTPGAARLDRAADLRQLSLAALAVALGRPLDGAHQPDVLRRLLDEVTEVAQIRGGERFADDLRSLLGTCASPSGGRSADWLLAEARRLASVLGTDNCRAALSDLACPHGALPDVASPERPDAAYPVSPLPGGEDVAEAAPPLPDLEGNVELSLDDLNEPGVVDLDFPDDPLLVLSPSANAADAELFDWKPDLVPTSRSRGVAPARQSEHEEWKTDLPTFEPATRETLPAPDPEPLDVHHVDWVHEPVSPAVSIADGPAQAALAAEAPPTRLTPDTPGVVTISARPAALIEEEPPAPATTHAEPSSPPEPPTPVVAPSHAPDAVQEEVPSPPGPPAGILLHRPVTPPSPSPPAAGEPHPSEDAPTRPNTYVPPAPPPQMAVSTPQAPPTPPLPLPPQVLPPPVAVQPPALRPPPVPTLPPGVPLPQQPIAFQPPPLSVVPPAAPFGAPVPLRLKAEPAPTRPRRMFDAEDARDAAADVGSATAGRLTRRRWAYAAAALLLLAGGAIASLPLLDRPSEARAAAEPAATAAPAAAVAPTVGGLHIETQPSGAAVLLNGEDVGHTPLQLDAVKPGRHVVTLSTGSATVKRTVRIEAGKVVTLDVPVYSGWVAIYSPVRLHVSAGGRSLGTTDTTRLMLSPGRHELTLTNRELGYSARQSVEIVPGEERVLNIEPKGTVNVNALPWAEVWVDGVRMGETPLADLEVPLGTREFVFKHPTYGERRLTTVITGKAPPLSVDFTKPGTD